MDHAALVFASIFPVPTPSHTTPTPVATPDLGHTAPGTSFGGPSSSHATSQSRTVKRNLAWSTATRFLSLPEQLEDVGRGRKRARDVEDALTYLLVGEGQTQDGEGIAEWYSNEVRIHFTNYVRPGLVELWSKEVSLTDAWNVLEETQRTLEKLQDYYIRPFNEHILPFIHRAASNMTIRANCSPEAADAGVVEIANKKFRRGVHATFAHGMPNMRFSKTLAYVIYDAGCRLFRLHERDDDTQLNEGLKTVTEVRDRMTTLLSGLEHVGLGQDSAQRSLAHAMNRLLDTFISSHYLKVDWYSKTSVVANLRAWIADGFCPLVELVMDCLKCDPQSITAPQLDRWQEMALTRLGKARVDDLFDFVIRWDKSLGAILDIKEYLRLDGAKEHLKTSFSQQISRRLLQPGATTTYILDVYINLIRTFQKLEPKGVLLQSVARPIRRYLKEREDTANIIISSLLIDLDKDKSQKTSTNGDLSYEIAVEMAKPFARAADIDSELNWDDMNWQPPPYDAPQDYRKPKVEDVIHFLLTLWDRDDFLGELKNILGAHLITCQDPEYRLEIRLLELIKIRLGEENLQACEVMLRDALESSRINDNVHSLQESVSAQQPQTPQGPGTRMRQSRHPPVPPGPTLNAQILSSYFWPTLRDDSFRIPAEIETLQQQYQSGFERIKGMRKLHWMNALGDSRITLSFDDRTEEFEGLTTWQVSVVYAFQPQPGEDVEGKGKQSEAITRDVEQLEEMLEMDASLVNQALAFWVGKSVLREKSPGTYTVIERLDSDDADIDAAAAALELAEVQAAQTTTIKSQADLLDERKDVYMSFIVGMLTNQGNMPVMSIVMMMRMMVQGGFPFGDEEVKRLLEELEANKKVMPLGGDIWGMRK